MSVFMHRVACMFALSLFLAVPTHAQPPTPPAGFLALDIFGGFAGHLGEGSADATNEAERSRFHGWDLGASVRPLPWFGIKGTIGRTWNGDTRLMHYLAGPSFTTSYAGNYSGSRVFAHVLVGVGSVNAPGLPGKTGLEILAGGGFDFIYIFRVQFDFLRLPQAPPVSDGTHVSQQQVRVFLGGVIPLCFRGCRPNDADGISVSK